MRINIKHFYLGIIIILCIITTSSVPGYQIGITNLELVICVLSLFALLSNLLRRCTLNNYLLLVVFLFLITIVEMFVYWERIFDWIRLIVLVLLLTQVGMYSIINKIDVFDIFYKIFRLYIIANTILYLAVSVLELNIPSTIYSNSFLPQYNNYFNLYYSTIGLSKENIFIFDFVRNDGFFTEPGLYSVFLVFMLLCWFYKKDKNRIDFILILFGIFTTFSTTGILLAMFIVFMHFVTNNKTFTNRSKIILIIIMICMGVVAAKIILEQKASAHIFSFTARSYDLISGIKLFMQKPIFGWGYKNHDAFYAFQGSFFYDVRNNSNGFVSIFYQLGLVGASLYIGPFILLYRALTRDQKKVFFYLSIVLVVIIMGEPIQYNTAGLFILAYVISCVILRSYNLRGEIDE